MAYEIIVKKQFRKKLVALLTYLEGEWGKAVADNFLQTLEKRIDTLSGQPDIGLKSEIKKSAQSILVTKHNRLYYRVKGKKIEIITLIDTRLNPKRNPYKR